MSISGLSSNPYGNYGYGASSSIGGSSAGSSAGTEDIKFANSYQSTPSAGSAEGGEQKSGGIKGFFKGIFNGAKNAVKSLFTPKGLLLAGAGLAACIAFPVAAPLVLGGLAVGAGGIQMFKGAQSGDSEKMGEGFFTAGTGALGVAGSGALSGAKAGGASGAASGAESGASGGISGFFSKLNPLNWFKSKPAAPAATDAAAVQPKAPATTSETPGLPPAAPGGQNPNPTSRPAAPIETEVASTPVVRLPGSNPPAATTAAEGTNVTRTPAPIEAEAATTPVVRLPGSNNTPATPAATAAPEATATATNATEGAAAAGNTATKSGPFAGARTNITNAYQYIRNPFTGPMPEGATAPGVFARTGQVLTGNAPGVAGKPIWTLPSTTGLSGGMPQPGQEQAAG